MASNTIRRHATDIESALSFVRNELPDQQMDDHKAKVVASFNESHAAWDVYRAHLREHGLP